MCALESLHHNYVSVANDDIGGLMNNHIHEGEKNKRRRNEKHFPTSQFCKIISHGETTERH